MLETYRNSGGGADVVDVATGTARTGMMVDNMPRTTMDESILAQDALNTMIVQYHFWETKDFLTGMNMESNDHRIEKGLRSF